MRDSSPKSDHVTRTGVAFALGAYVSWGLFPAFWKLVAGVPAPEVLAHRIVWSLAFVLVMVAWSGRWREILSALENRRMLATLSASTLCVSFNWLTFIWAVAEGRVLETSLGYFLNPLVNVLLGVAILKERLRPLQWTAVGLAASGVLALAVGTGSPPWVALALAISFGIYGLLRKRAPMAPLTGLAVETGLLAPLALAYLAWTGLSGGGAFGRQSEASLLLIAGGLITALPLMWFAAAAARLRYSTLGFFQYLAPTGHFLLAVLAYDEPLTFWHLVTFGAIWTAIALYLADAAAAYRRSRRDSALETA